MTENLPTMIDAASRRLADAKTSGELLEAKAVAQAALHYAKVTSAANETHADCLRIIVRAEMKMADAIDEGQESGEVHPPYRTVHSSDSYATFSELGIDRQRLAEWRQLRDAGPEAIEEAIKRQLEAGTVPTKRGIYEAVVRKEERASEWDCEMRGCYRKRDR